MRRQTTDAVVGKSLAGSAYAGPRLDNGLEEEGGRGMCVGEAWVCVGEAWVCVDVGVCVWVGVGVCGWAWVGVGGGGWTSVVADEACAVVLMGRRGWQPTHYPGAVRHGAWWCAESRPHTT